MCYFCVLIIKDMKTRIKKLFLMFIAAIFMISMAILPYAAIAQDAEGDTAAAVQDNSSSFNDSVKYDDMAPVFYEAEEDETTASAADSGYGDLWLYGGAVVVLLIILIVLRKKGKKKS